MKTFLLILFLLPLAGLAGELKIFSMNLHCGLDDWKQRVDVVVQEILKHDPDVIGLQEVCYNDEMNMAVYLRDQLKKSGYEARTFQTVETHRSFLRFNEQVLLISRHKAEEVKTGHLPSVTMLRNGYVAARLGKFWYLTTHLHFALPGVRKNQYKEIEKIFGKKPTVLFGDLNSSPDDGETNVLKNGGWVPAFDGPTYPSENPDKTFDGFWMGRLFYDEVLATTMERHFMNARFRPSDHLGISLNVLFR